MRTAITLSLLAVACASQAVIVYGAGGSIPDNAPTAGFTSTITITDGGTLNAVVVEGLSHTWAGDVTITVSSLGSMVTRVGQTSSTSVGDSSNYGGDYRFQNGGADLWAAAAAATSSADVIPGGIYKPSGALNAVVTLPATIGAGTYTITVTDSASLDTGAFQRWGIDYNAVPEPGTYAALGLGLAVIIRRKRSK